MWNPFKKAKSKMSATAMGMMQKVAMKKLEKMSPEERAKMAGKFMNSESISKNKNQILAVMEQMKASGQITDEQIEMAKRKLGL